MRTLIHLAAAVLVILGAFPATGNAMDRAVELAVVEERWQDVLETLDAISPDDRGPIESFVEHEACLILGRPCAHRQIEPATADIYSASIVARWVDSVADANPNKAFLVYLQAEAMSRLGDYDAALDGYTKALTIDSSYAPAYCARGYMYMVNGLLSKAVSDFTAAIGFNPHNGLYYVNRGSAYDNRGDYESAISDYARALEYLPNDPGTLYNWGNTYRHLDNSSKAIEKYTAALAADPTLAAAYYNRANSHLELGNTEQAIADYEMFIKYSPSESEPRVKTAKQRIAFLKGAGKVDLAESERSLEEGIHYLNNGQLGPAKNSLLKAIELNPMESDAYYFLGGVYLQRRANDSAIYYFSKAIELKPNDTTAYFNRAQCLRELEKPHEALNDLSSAIHCDPHYAKAYRARAEVYETLGEPDSAIADYEAFIASSSATPPDVAAAPDTAVARYIAVVRDTAVVRLIIESIKSPDRHMDTGAVQSAQGMYQAFENQEWGKVADYVIDSDLEEFKATMARFIQKLAGQNKFFALWGNIYKRDDIANIPARELFADVMTGMATSDENFRTVLTVKYENILKTEAVNDTCIVVTTRLKEGFPKPYETNLYQDTVRIIGGEYISDLPQVIEFIRQIFESTLNH